MIKDLSNSTFSNGRRTPSLDEVERKLANRRKSLSAILGSIYSSEQQIPNKMRSMRMNKTSFPPNEQREILEQTSDAQGYQASISGLVTCISCMVFNFN